MITRTVRTVRQHLPKQLSTGFNLHPCPGAITVPVIPRRIHPASSSCSPGINSCLADGWFDTCCVNGTAPQISSPLRLHSLLRKCRMESWQETTKTFLFYLHLCRSESYHNGFNSETADELEPVELSDLSHSIAGQTFIQQLVFLFSCIRCFPETTKMKSLRLNPTSW